MSLRRLALAFALGLAAACSAPGTQPPPEGTDDFTSAAVGGNGRNREANDAATGAAAPSGGAAPRTVEEGDVYKVIGDELYVLNMYRGLQLLDVSDPDHPRKQGRSTVLGWPVEMYVRNGYAYVIVSDYFTWQQVPDAPARPFHGSQVRIIDIRQPDAPVVVGGIDLEGAISDTRIVGDVLYVVANRWAWYDNFASADDTNDLVVSSIDLARPSAPVLRESLHFPGTSNVIHVSPTTLYVASPDGQWPNPQTNVTLVDISDPAGHLAARGSLSVAGSVEQRFQLDEHDGRFRIVSHQGSWGQDGAQTLSVFDLSPSISLLSTLSLPNTGGLFATRFDGDRAYLVTMVSVDPLEVVDLRDPANPVLAHSLVIPGVLHQLAPRGDRLLALGTDDRWSGVAASLFDVHDPQNPTLLSRVQVGAGSTWSNATWDDKALKVLDAEGMMLVPFSGWDQPNPNVPGRYFNGFQILSFDRQALTADGAVEQDGEVSRVTSHRSRLLSISDRVLQSVDATNRASPRITAAVELARDVSDFAIVGGHGVTLSSSGWWWDTQSTELRVTDLANPEDGVLGRLALPFRASRLLADGTGVIVLGYPQAWDGTARAVRVDLTAPTAPRLVGTATTLGAPYSSTSNSYAYVESAAIVRPGVIALPVWRSWTDAAGEWRTTSSIVTAELVAGVTGSVDLAGTLAGEFVSDGTNLWTSHQEPATSVSGQAMSRFYADRLDVTDAAHPSIGLKVNVPGTLVGVSGASLFTRDYLWLANGNLQHALAECTLNGARATLRAYLLLDEGLGRIIASGDRLYATTQPWWWSGTSSNGVSLRVYASSPTAPLAEVSRTDVRDWLQLRDLRGGHLFLGSGYWGGPWDFGLYGRGAVADVGMAAPGGMWFDAAQGLVDYSLANADRPAFRQFVRTQGWVQGLQVDQGRLYVSRGIYGIDSVPLTP